MISLESDKAEQKLLYGRIKHLYKVGLPGGSVNKESTCNEGDLSSIPRLERSSGKGHATHSNILAWRISMDRGEFVTT